MTHNRARLQEKRQPFGRARYFAIALAAGMVLAGASAAKTDEINVDEWIFRESAADGRMRLEILLHSKVEELARDCELSEIQKRKLETAGRGDIQRLLARVEDIKTEFAAAANDRRRVNRLRQECQQLNLAVHNGVFGEGSLFGKTLRKTLTPEHVRKRETSIHARRVARYEAGIERTIAWLDEPLGLGADQHRQLVPFLVEQTPLPESFGQYDLHVVILQMSRLPEGRLKPLFDDDQWNRLQELMRGSTHTGQYLETFGFLPKATAGAEREGKEEPHDDD